MLVTKRSPFTGKETTLDIPITQAQYEYYYNSGSAKPIRQLFPNLTPSQREFLMTGLTDADWDSLGPEPVDVDEEDDVDLAEVL